MIIDPNSTKMTTPQNQDMQAPPSYETAVKDTSSSGPFVAEGTSAAANVKVPVQPDGPVSRVPAMPTATVYNYVNPTTGEHVVSLLPPDHPQMMCLQQGGHVPRTHFGILGVLAAIFWFPLGVGCCLLDRRVTCARCGIVIDDGICG